MDDGKDHTVITVDQTFPSFAKLGKAPKQGDNITYWGNPKGLENMERRGYVSGIVDGSAWIDANSTQGDSGAGLFSDRGEVVGVVSSIAYSDGFVLMVAHPMKFTADELK